MSTGWITKPPIPFETLRKADLGDVYEAEAEQTTSEQFALTDGEQNHLWVFDTYGNATYENYTESRNNITKIQDAITKKFKVEWVSEHDEGFSDEDSDDLDFEDDMDFDKIASNICKSDVKGSIRTAGQVQFIKDQGPLRRDIRAPGFKWSPEALRNLAKILWAIQRANSYTMAAYRVFSKMNSSDFSPDGLLGGRGYIQAVKDMRKDLAQVAEVLSAFADTMQDEIDADHWKETEPDQETTELVEDAQDVKGNPDEYVEGEYSEVAPEDESEYDLDISNPDADDLNPTVDGEEDEEELEEDEDYEGQSQFASLTQPLQERYDYGQIKPKKKEDDEPGSQLPTDTGDQGAAKTETESFMNTTTPDHGNYAAAFNRMLTNAIRKASIRTADSSLPVDTLSGPRIDHIGPGAGNEDGFYNDEDVWSSDDLTGDGLSSGTNETKPLIEDWISDGVSPHDNPTQGDESVLQISSKVAATYSWLPGADNSKNLDYYKLGLSEDDINWMRDHSDPDPPAGYLQPKKKINLWEPRS